MKRQLGVSVQAWTSEPCCSQSEEDSKWWTSKPIDSGYSRSPQIGTALGGQHIHAVHMQYTQRSPTTGLRRIERRTHPLSDFGWPRSLCLIIINGVQSLVEGRPKPSFIVLRAPKSSRTDSW